MTEDIGKVIEAVTKLITTASGTVPKVTDMIKTPIEVKIQSATTAATVLTQLLQSQQDEIANNLELAALSCDFDPKEKANVYKNNVDKMMKKLKKNIKKRKKKTADAYKKGMKSKITKVIESLDSIQKKLDEINDQIDYLMDKKSELDDKLDGILNSTGGEEDEIAKEEEEEEKQAKKKAKEEKEMMKNMTPEELAAYKKKKKMIALEKKKKKLLARKTELKCKMARLLAMNSENDKLCELAQLTQDVTFRQLAKLPMNAIKTIEALVDFILFIMDGVMSPDDPDLDIKQLILDLMDMIEPVVSGMANLPVPKVPGLSQLQPMLDILKKLSDPITGSKDDIDAKIGNLPSLPAQFLPIVTDILTAMGSMSTSLVMALVNLIFQMIDAIIGMFEQICGVIGVPGIPFPLNLLPTVWKLIPHIWNFLICTPVNVGRIFEKILREKVQELLYLQLPSPPDLDEIIPEDFELCAKHQKEQEEQAAAELKAAEEEAKKVAELEAKKEENSWDSGIKSACEDIASHF